MAPSVGATGIRTRNLVLFKDVVPSAFVTKLKFQMATRVDENSQRTFRPVGRGLNPLVANVFPPAFAIKSKKQRDNREQDVLSYSACAEPGIDPGPPGYEPGALSVVLQAFSLLQISQRANLTLHFTTRTDKFFAETLQFDVVPSGIRSANHSSPPGHVRIDVAGQTSLASLTI